MKKCTKCGLLKPETEFNKCAKNKDGLQYKCKDCQKASYYENHEHNLAYDRQRTHTEERVKYKQQYDKQYYQENVDKKIAYAKQFYKEHKENWKLTEEQKQKKKEYFIKNKDKINEQKRILRASNPVRRISETISSSIYSSLKGDKQNYHWENLVNFNLQQLKEHLESMFDSNMNWDNYGSYWEIDHIIPINTFNFTSFNNEDFKVCWSLINLRPLEKIANRSRPKDGSDIPDSVKQSIIGGKQYAC